MGTPEEMFTLKGRVMGMREAAGILAQVAAICEGVEYED